MSDVRVNRWLDLADRAGWTAIQTAAASAFVVLTSGMEWQQALATVGIATALAVCKVVIAQRSGTDELGAAVPGHVLEEGPAPPSKPLTT